MKTNHYPNKITFHSVTIVPMTSFTLKSTSKLRSFLHFRCSIVIPRFIPHANNRGVPRIWEGGGPRNFFFRFGNLHVAKRHAAHGEAMRIVRGVRGHAPPRKFFETVQFGAF